MEIKEILKSWVSLYTKWLYAAQSGEDLRAGLIKRLEKYSENSQDEYSLYVRPKYASQMPVQELSAAQKRTAIVMQGPLVREHDFTLETVKCYKKLFPAAIVILSTWDTEDVSTLRRLQEQENCRVVALAQPEHSGILNLNYQIVSTMAGIRKACELQREYVFKTRCDQRFMKPGLLDYMVSLCEAFPLEDGICGQTQRIICDGGGHDSLFRAYWLGDFFSFGRTEDMLRYWDYELDPVDWPRPVVWEKLAQMRCSWQQRTEERLGAEPNIVRNFIKRIENTAEPDCTVKNYWDTVKRRLITLSRAEAGGYWIKYEGRYDEATWMGHYKAIGDDATKCRCYNWNFGLWLALYTGTMRYDASYERFQQEPSDIKV